MRTRAQIPSIPPTSSSRVPEDNNSPVRAGRPDAPCSDESLVAVEKRSLSADVASGIRTRKSTEDTARMDPRQLTARPNGQLQPSTQPPPYQSKPSRSDVSSSPTKHRPSDDLTSEMSKRPRARLKNPWSCSSLTLLVTAVALLLSGVILRSFLTRQQDPKGCAMSFMRPSFAKFPDFDTEHTRLASKYSLYLYREGGIDEDTRVKGIPILFIPGNAGSYKQVRPLAAEAANYFHQNMRTNTDAIKNGKRPLDFFSVDFNEDITAFHGQTMLDQAEYLNEAVAYILSLYHNPHRSLRDPDLPDPTSVILVGHSMGGIVARTMLTMPNYQTNSINTIVTLSAPHARAPVSFDADIVTTYKNVNEYWRNSYSQKWANNNPLRHVTLISIAGGGLDTVVPSDYSTLSSLVPPTHGFTVFTSTIPRVWTGMDHLAITWCDQLRKSVVGALYDVIDAGRPNQTRPRPDRITAFKKWLLTGMEDVAEKTLTQKEPGTLLTLEDNSNAIISQGERLTLRHLGTSKKSKAYLLPVPPQGSPDRRRFTLLTNQKLDQKSQTNLDVMFCSVFPLHAGQSSAIFSMNMDLSGDTSGSTRLACKNAASDAILLPASTKESKFPFDDAQPFSYLQYDLEHLSDHQFVAVVDKATTPVDGWVITEFSSKSESDIYLKDGLEKLFLSGIEVSYPRDRPMMTEINIPSVHSSLLAYKLSITQAVCGNDSGLFTPLLRQHISEPYESKFFVNVKEADISMHGISPFLPPALKAHSATQGLSLQIWSDPTCHNAMDVSMKIDMIGSMGKLWMRYRTVFAAFPLLVIALVLRKQFQFYDSTGIFMSFSESMDQSLRRSLPVFMAGLTFLSLFFSKTSQNASLPQHRGPFDWRGNATEGVVDFTVNDLLLGSQDPFFWFLTPVFGIISVGICIGVNYATLFITHFFSISYVRIIHLLSSGDRSRIVETFATTSLKKRIITASVLLVLVSTVIPYQFVFVVLCVVQLSTNIRALSVARETHTPLDLNFYNYTHSLLLLMLWILPINVPALVVWLRNLTLSAWWFIPLSPLHNVLSIAPFVLLVEILSTGQMLPRLESKTRIFTNMFFFGLAVYAAVYGVTYAYLLHYIVNVICAWLAGMHAKRTLGLEWWGVIERTRGGATVGGSGAKSPGTKSSGAGGWGKDKDDRSVKKRP